MRRAARGSLFSTPTTSGFRPSWNANSGNGRPSDRGSGLSQVQEEGLLLGRRLAFDDLWTQNDAIVSSSLVRRSAFEQAGGFWTLRACEDYHLWLRLTADGWDMANVPEDLVVYMPTAQSLSRQVESFAAAELACVRDIAERTRMSTARMNEDWRNATNVTRAARFTHGTCLSPGALPLLLCSTVSRLRNSGLSPWPARPGPCSICGDGPGPPWPAAHLDMAMKTSSDGYVGLRTARLARGIPRMHLLVRFLACSTRPE